MSRYRDFDAFFEEQENNPVQLKIFGETHNLPSSLPAIVMLKILRMQKEKTLNELEMMEMCMEIFGKKRFEKWLEKGLTVDQMQELIRWAFEQYRQGDSGNTKAPAKGQIETSSKNGESSKQISQENTE